MKYFLTLPAWWGWSTVYSVLSSQCAKVLVGKKMSQCWYFCMIVHFWYKISQHLLYLCILERKLISFQFGWDWTGLSGCWLQSTPATTGALIGLWAPAVPPLLTAAECTNWGETWPSSYAALHSVRPLSSLHGGSNCQISYQGPSHTQGSI